MSTEHAPLDMNEMFKAMTQEAVNAATPGIVANALITSGNAMRTQGYSMLGAIDTKFLLTVPALLENGSSVCLLPFIRPLAGFFRLIIGHTAGGERTLVVVAEDENNLINSKFVTLSEAQAKEINRQLDVLGVKHEGAGELGLFFGEAPVEGFAYFQAPSDEVVEDAAISKEIPAAEVATEVAVASEAPAAVVAADTAPPAIETPAG